MTDQYPKDNQRTDSQHSMNLIQSLVMTDADDFLEATSSNRPFTLLNQGIPVFDNMSLHEVFGMATTLTSESRKKRLLDCIDETL
jgi:hypothetical protein